jgi:hypothetical protein
VNWATFPQRVRRRARRRRLQVYVVGLGGTGTTTLCDIFEHYRAAHEVDRRRMLPIANAARTGRLSPARRRWELRRRNLRFGLEVDSAAFLTLFVPDLARMYPRARFVVSVRDCFTWMDTRVEKWLRSGERIDPNATDWAAPYRWSDYGVTWAVTQSPEDAPLVERDLPPIGSLAKRWAQTYADVLRSSPPDRTLVMRTEDIDTSLERLAEFCGVDGSTLTPGVHRNAAPSRERLLSQLSRDHVLHEVERYCAPLMEQFWGPEWRTLVHRVPGWDTVTP